MSQQNKSSSEENDKLAQKLEETLKALKELETEKAKKEIESEKVYEEKKEEVVAKKKEPSKTPDIELNSKAEGEIGLISTVLGCRENRDRIEFAEDLKDYMELLELTKEERELVQKRTFTLASDYKLNISSGLKKYIKECKVSDLARAMPKYEFISPSLALIIM